MHVCLYAYILYDITLHAKYVYDFKVTVILDFCNYITTSVDC